MSNETLIEGRGSGVLCLLTLETGLSRTVDGTQDTFLLPGPKVTTVSILFKSGEVKFRRYFTVHKLASFFSQKN